MHITKKAQKAIIHIPTLGITNWNHVCATAYIETKHAPTQNHLEVEGSIIKPTKVIKKTSKRCIMTSHIRNWIVVATGSIIERVLRIFVSKGCFKLAVIRSALKDFSEDASWSIVKNRKHVFKDISFNISRKSFMVKFSLKSYSWNMQTIKPARFAFSLRISGNLLGWSIPSG